MGTLKQLMKKEGSLSMPLAAIFGLLSLSGTAVLFIGNYWHLKVRTQLKLDHCTGRFAIELRNRLNSISNLNQKIELLRISGAAALASGNLGALEGLKQTIYLTLILQEKEILLWKKSQAKWWIDRSCGNAGEKKPLPDIPTTRPPADLLGEKPLNWGDLQNRHLRIDAYHFRRSSRSFVFRKQSKTGQIWVASWRSPYGSP